MGIWSALVVEDEALVAGMLEAVLIDMGCASVECLDNLPAALIALSGHQPDVALLDMNLHERLSFPVAEQLQALGVPFIFVTGHGRFGVPGWTNPVVRKPFTELDIKQAIQSAAPHLALPLEARSTDAVDKAGQVEALLAAPDLADALESEQFRRFLDQVPIAIVVAEMKGPERIVYANPEFEKLSGQSAAEVEGEAWTVLHGQGEGKDSARKLGASVVDSSDCVGTFQIERAGRDPAVVDAYSNIIEDDDGRPAFRLAALVDVGARGEAQRHAFEQQIREKDTLLLEVQHRVKNNLQMITALIRIETRNAEGRIDTAPFDRLSGRIQSIQLVYKLLSDTAQGDEIDLGVYLSEIVSSVMHAHAVEGIRLDLKVDAYPVSVNVAMPTGLVVNELLTNALKHAFKGRDGGTITLHSLADSSGCRVVIADDGVGLPEGVEWPKHGKLGALIVRSLRENANAELTVDSAPGKGTRVTIVFTRKASAPAQSA